jgi:hypothetical protein
MNTITKAVRLAHVLDVTPATERARSERTWTARCSCGFEQSAHSKKGTLREFRAHRQRVQEQLDRPVNAVGKETVR